MNLNKGMLLEQISNAKEFRAAKTAEHPDDTRNKESVSALLGLLEYVSELDDSGLLLGADDGSLEFSAWLNERLGRYGFDEPEDNAEFVSEVISMASGVSK